MPEGKKKDSFTFSDKIKTNKQTAPKSFANRISSKIGLDGKPRQTLFERAKRDTPFFIAAIVALLLLPFLYKYSGQVSEDASVITPGYEDAIVNPDRSGFDLTGENTEGQIAQLSGRDSMDLIVGFGKHREEESEDSLSDLYRSGLSEDKAASYTRSDMDEEINNTNIYKYRKKAPVQTRAAFRRATTTIGRLGQAGLSGRGGGRAIAPWGGSLKTASKRMRPQGPRNSTKPVSLQKLTPAGKPSRSSFGQGAAAEARRSKDAMSKGNAMQALMDAQMKPVEPGRIGGILGGDFGGPGGGNGNLQRQFAFNGKEPWWWDLMKTRSQMEWEKKFNYKWGWIDFGTKLLQNLLDPFLSCFFTGTDDWSMGKMFGAVEGAGDGDKCDKMTAEDWKKCGKCTQISETMTKWACHVLFDYKGDKDDKDPWQGGSKAGSNMTWWQSRRDCWTNGVNAYISGKLALKEASDCNNLAAGYYQVNPSGAARKWNTYIYVVARNYMPEVSKGLLKENTPRGFLCTEGSDNLKIGALAEVGAGAIGLNKKFDGETSGTNKDEKEVSIRQTKEQKLTEDIYDRDAETVQNGCVIYLQRGDTFNYKNFETSTIVLLKKLLTEQGFSGDVEVGARNAFLQLDLMFVESFSAKDKIGLGGHTVNLPMTYHRFRNAYIRHKRTQTANDKTFAFNRNVDNRKYRIEGADYVMGDRCPWNNALALACVDYPQDTFFDNINGIDEFKFPTAYVAFKRGYHGLADPTASNGGNWKNGKTSVSRALEEIQVTAEFIPLKKGEIGNVEQHTVDPLPVQGEPSLVQYQFKHVVNADKSNRVDFPKNLPGEVIWRLYRSGKLLETRTCDVNSAADDRGVSVTIEEKEGCQSKDESPACCAEYAAEHPDEGYAWNKELSKCVKGRVSVDVPERIPGATTAYTIFAPNLNLVPKDPQAREEYKGDDKIFGPSLVSQYKAPDGRQQCTEEWGFKMDSTKARDFVKKVADTYNKQHPGLPIQFEGEYPRDGEFVDALNVALSVNITEVPAAAVCELGRDFVRMSKDPHAGKSNTVGRVGIKQADRVFHNDLGAFLAYVHEDSILYPQSHLEIDGQEVCDWRFQPKGYNQAGCPDVGPEMAPRYAYNNYNGIKKDSKGKSLEKFKESLAPTQQRYKYPLKDLVQGHASLWHECGNCKSVSGKDNVKIYNSDDGFALMLRDTTVPSGQGKACEAFAGDRMMNVADVLHYIEAVCTNGLDYKPYGVGASAYKKGQKPTTQGGGKGSDQGVH